MRELGLEKARGMGREFESEAKNERKKANRTSRFLETGRERGLWSQSQARSGLARMMKGQGLSKDTRWGWIIGVE